MEAITRLTFGWLGGQTPDFPVSQIDPMAFPLLTFPIKSVVISRIKQDVKAVPTGKRGPIAVANTFLTLYSTRAHPVFVVLETARNSEIRFRVVERNPIIFSCGNLVQVIPVFATGKTLIHAAIRPEQQTLANLRFRGLVFVFRLGRLRRRNRAGLNRERMTIRVNLLA